ncbi:hypothetical protein GCM10010252_76050 [Streptomyces aureoverticillatus]|nr:hypothetical protein GCM10010252_76050 [Streptomyces aureoverticillatus]
MPGQGDRAARGGAGDLRPVEPAGLPGPGSPAAAPADLAGFAEEWAAGLEDPAAAGFDGLEWSVVEDWVEVAWPTGESVVTVPGPASGAVDAETPAWWADPAWPADPESADQQPTARDGEWVEAADADHDAWTRIARFAPAGWDGPLAAVWEGWVGPVEDVRDWRVGLRGDGRDGHGGPHGDVRDGQGGPVGDVGEAGVAPGEGSPAERGGPAPVDEDEWASAREDVAHAGGPESAAGPQDDWADPEVTPEVTGQDGPLFHVRLAFDGSRSGVGGEGGEGGDRAGGTGSGCCRDGGGGADVLASVSGGRITIEELRAQPPLPLASLATLAARIEGPLNDAVRGLAERHEGEAGGVESACRNGGSAQEPVAARRGRPSARRGSAVRHVTAEAYRGALDDGEDPVLAVMRATGHSRRKSLRLIAGARDAGLLMPRHHRR